MSYSPQEKQYFDQLFSFVDKENIGILPGQDAYPFLTSSNLPTNALGEIWALADPENNGFLDKNGWYKAARLIGWIQKGGVTQVDEALSNKPGPYPTFDGAPPPPAQAPVQPQMTGQRAPLSAQVTGSTGGSLPPLNPADRAKFTRLFAGAGPSNGLVNGDKARDMFLKSNLGYDKLGQIWNLADTQERGSLDLTDFIVGMHLIQSAMANPSLNLPATLPPGLYESASGGRAPPPRGGSVPSPISRQHTGNAAVASPIRPQYTGGMGGGILQPQRTGQSATGTATPPRTAPATKSFASPPTASSFSTLPSTSSFGGPTRQGSAFAPAQQQQAWDVNPQAKATSDQFFSQLDTQNKGVIEGDVAVPFMLQSQLDEGVLANIWDLADIRKEGKLTRDEFAVAMHLINTKLAGQDIPSSLPNSLVPPSLRDTYGNGAQEVLGNQPSSATKDLFDLFGDDEAAPTPTPKPASPQPPQQPPQTQSFAAAFMPQQVQAPPSRQMTAQSTGQQAMSPMATGQQANTGFGKPPFTARGSDLLGDDTADDKPSSVPDHSAELGNKQNQLANTTKNLEQLEKTHAELDSTAKSSAEQLEELEQKLTSARERHESETKAVADLRIRVGEQKERHRKLESEVISAESDLSAMRSEKDELEQALLRDKEEIRGLQKMMKEVEEEKTGMKLVLEKLKKEARQQKGMLTIAKKQLSTAEGGRDTVQQEIKDSEREIEEDKAEIERTKSLPAPSPAPTSPPTQPSSVFSPSALAAGVPLPATPKALSPVATGASTRSNNPFERLAASARSAPPPPQPAQQQPRSALSPPAQAEEPTSPSLGLAALGGIGAAATAAAGVVVAGAETLYDAAKEAVTHSPDATTQTKEAETDPFGAATAGDAEKTPVPPASGEDVDPFGAPRDAQEDSTTDPFGASSTPATAHKSGFDTEDFDSGFGDSFAADSSATPAVTQPTEDMHLAPHSEPGAPAASTSSDFDSAFADFDRPHVQPEDLAEGIPEGLPKSELPEELSARPEVERSESTQAVAPDTVPGTPVTGIFMSGAGSSPASIRAPLPASGLSRQVEPEQDVGESSDEEEGPEDLEGPKRGYSAVRQESEILPVPENQPEPEPILSEEPVAAPELTASPPSGQQSTALAPPLPLGEEVHQQAKVRRSAPPPPSQKSTRAPSADEFDPFGAPVAPAAQHSLPVAQDTVSSTTAGSGATPKNAAFDEDDFDFSDLPPAQVDQSQAHSQLPPGAAPAGAAGSHSFDDEFAGFDDEFEKPEFNNGSENSGSGSVSKSYEMVSPPPQRFDEWGFGGNATAQHGQTESHPQGQSQAPPASAFSFDDAFGGDFEPSGASQAQHQEAQYAPPPGPPPGQQGHSQERLEPPPMPERRPSGAQPDDIEQVKNLCSMGFSRGLVVEALAANGYDVQKALNVLLSA
ncbi:hypothetical protein IAU60_000598 [Kwoniella sp. DSM 27419]